MSLGWAERGMESVPGVKPPPLTDPATVQRLLSSTKGNPMSLRDEAITHMAAKVCVELTTCFPHLEEATMSLTALLDYLDAHTEAWADAAQPDNDRVHYEGVAAELIRGLR